MMTKLKRNNMSTNLFVRLAAKLHRMTSRAIEKNNRTHFFHPEELLSASPADTSNNFDKCEDEADTELVGRIITAYQEANKADLGDSMWKVFFASYHIAIHQSLMNGNVGTVSEIFRNPSASDLFHGFDILTKSFQGSFDSKPARNLYAKVCLDGLVRFAESASASPLDNPEDWPKQEWEAEEVLETLSNKCWPFSVPNPFPGEHGLRTSRGIISYRVPQALYQAWRIKQLVNGIDNPRILEIGAGLGRTAYYAYELGLRDYSIVDIPITATSQAYFLGRTLGEGNIHLDGEQSQESSHKIRILTPQTFLDERKPYDLILNADGLTEIDISAAKAYWQEIKSSTNMFLSINHEANAFRVQDLIADDLPSIEVNRSPYWMRPGYVEELIRM
jgi:hypothetical protein